MEIAVQVLVLLHLIGFASLFGGVITQARSVPEVNAAMLHGAATLLLTGVALVVLHAVAGEVRWAPAVIKLVIAAAVTVLVVANRRFTEIPRGLWALIGVAALADAAIGVFWA